MRPGNAPRSFVGHGPGRWNTLFKGFDIYFNQTIPIVASDKTGRSDKTSEKTVIRGQILNVNK